MKSILISTLFLWSVTTHAQSKPADTVVIKVGEGSKIIVAIQDKKDLETMKQYDFQKLINDLIIKVEEKDTASQQEPAANYLKESVQEQGSASELVMQDEDEEEDDEDWSHRTTWHSRRTYHSINFDLGMNNYLENGKFPNETNSLYTVKPWGSWYVGITSNLRTRISNKFFLEWGGGISWYNFKFQNEKTMITKDDNTVIFSENLLDVDFTKSKLTATYLQAQLVPMIDFGGNRRKPSFFDGHGSDSFRFGAGPYVGYRIDSYSKQVYKEEGDKIKPKDHDHFYLNNLRYGIRAQLGFEEVDFFFNYDLNGLFIENKGPNLNAFSFGITF